jgi:hypothetical protein
MTTLNDAVIDLAPLTPPPCFPNRQAWLEYLKSAAAAQNHKGENKVILTHKGRTHEFNYAYDFCQDCDTHYKRLMQSQMSCRPNFLRSLERNGEVK